MKHRFIFLNLIVLPSVLIGLNACSTLGAVNNALSEKTKTVEYYRIFDIQTDANRNTVADAASKGLGKNTGSAQESRPIPSSSTPPVQPSRFKITNPFADTKLGAFTGGAGSVGFKLVTCDDAVWTAKAQRKASGSNQLNLDACLFPYQGGYHLNLYAIFSKQEGGFMELSRKMAYAAVGTPEQWTEKTFLDIVKTIKQETNATVKFIEGYPKPQGTPWLDNNDGTLNN